MWPGVLLTRRYCSEIVPVSSDIIGFWITRLHGPEALYKDLFPAISRAAYFLTVGAETKAQGALDALDLFVLSHDGAAVMKHREITAWYQTKNPDFDYLSPRDYLRGKNWEAWYKVGIKALVKFKVLKP